MSILSPEEGARRMQRELGLVGMLGQRSSLANTPFNVNPQFSFAEQMGAAFRQENLAVAYHLSRQRQDFGSVPGFNPREHVGIYEQYADKFPSLLTAESPAEMAHIKRRIDQEIEDRAKFQGQGFLRTMAAMAPAGMTSPENLIPYLGAVRVAANARAAVAAGRLSRGAATARGTAAVALEGAASQGVAELGLQQLQKFRTTEESIAATIGAAVFGTVLGGAGATLGAAKRKAAIAALGAENAEIAAEETLQRALGPTGVLREGTELGVRFRTALREFDNLVDTGVDPDALAKSPELARIDGILTEAIASENKNLSRLLAADKAIGRLVSKTMFFNPGGRLARSPLESANRFSDAIIRSGLREENIDVAALEPILQLAQVRLFQAQGEVRRIYTKHREVLGDIGESDFREMAGIAARDQLVEGRSVIKDDRVFDRADGERIDPFERIRESEQAKAAVAEAANLYNDFNQSIRKMGGMSGAFTEGQLSRANQRDLFMLLDDNYVSRSVNRDMADRYQENMKNSIQAGLIHQKKELIDSGYLGKKLESHQNQRAILEARLNRMDEADLPNEAAALKNAIQNEDARIKDIENLIDEFDNEERFKNLVDSVFRNYRGDPANPLSTGTQGTALRQRVLKIPDRFIEGYMVSDIDQLMAQVTRSLLPDLVISRRMQKMFNGRDLAASTGQRSEKLDARLEEWDKAGRGVTREEFESFQNEAEELLADAAIMNLVDNARLLVSFQKVFEDAPSDPRLAQKWVQEQIYRIGDNRKNFQRRLRTAERQENDLRVELADEIKLWKAFAEEHFEGPMALANARRAANAGDLPVAEMEQLAETLGPLWNKVKERDQFRLSLRENTREFNRIATAINDQNPKGLAMPIEELQIRSTRFNAERAEDPLDALEQLRFEYDMASDVIGDRRRASYYHNVSETQMIRAMEREAEWRIDQGEWTRTEANKHLFGRRGKPGEPAAGGAIDDIQTVMARLRMRHGESADQWRYVGKAVRDLNYMRAMGSVVISSLPDMTMAIGQAGLWNYAKTMMRWMSKDWKIAAETPDGRNALATMHWAMETVIGRERTKTLYGIESEFSAGVPGMKLSRKERLAEMTQSAVDQFGRLTLINRWNGFNKAIASMAIQHRISDVGVRLAQGKKVKEFELGLIKNWGFTESSLKKIGKTLLGGAGELDETGFGSFWYSKSQTWADRELALQFDTGVLKAVSDTIITPGAGDLATMATKDTLGRMFFQFRSFSQAATSRMLTPAFQRFYKWQDPNLAIQTASMWLMGMGVYAINEYMNGRDPNRIVEGKDGQDTEPWRRWVMEGMDRSGILGLLTEVNASWERAGLPGLTSIMGTQPASRFRGRGVMESVLGPGVGAVFDVPNAVFAGADARVTEGEANLMRRMIPYQNLWQLRLLLDVGPSLMAGGNYFEEFKPIQQRARDLFVEE